MTDLEDATDDLRLARQDERIGERAQPWRRTTVA